MTKNQFFTILCSILLVLAFKSQTKAQTESSVLPTASLENVKNTVDALSDGKLIAITDGALADFDGDGFTDMATIVELKEKSAQGISLIKNIYDLKTRQDKIGIQYLCAPTLNCCDETDFNSPALLVIHGKSKSLKDVKPANKPAILFRGRTNILAFQKNRQDGKVSSLLDFYKSKNGMEIWLTTEASEVIISRKKGKYVSFETEP